jgi:hypothetical protein
VYASFWTRSCDHLHGGRTLKGKGKDVDTLLKVSQQAAKVADRAFAGACAAQARGDKDAAAQGFAYAKHGYDRAERAALSAADKALNMPEGDD